jgi:hypothetical protein
MPRYKVEVTDVLHIRRTAILDVIAKTAEAAEQKALDAAHAKAHKIDWDEEQVDADPYEASVLSEIGQKEE